MARKRRYTKKYAPKNEFRINNSPVAKGHPAYIDKECETYPHFRYYKKSKHPALITGEYSLEEYKYRKVMHSGKDGGRNNECVYPNPDPKDKDPMFIGRRTRHDLKGSFESWKLPWKYPKKKK